MTSSLKTRIIGVIPIIEGIAVQSIGFRKYLPLGDPSIIVENLNRHDIDEIVILDIGIHKGSLATEFKIFEKCALQSSVPISIGGGINNISIANKIIKNIADKVVINTSIFLKPNIVTDIASRFGSQAIIGSLDIKLDRETNRFFAYSHGGSRNTKYQLDEAIHLCEKIGCGEILINSIDNDGMKNGFNKKLIKEIHSEKNLPLLIAGGAGSFKHLNIGKKLNIDGICVGNYFNFAEHQVLLTKRYLKNLGYKISIGRDIHLNTKFSLKFNSQLPPSEKILLSNRFSIKKKDNERM